MACQSTISIFSLIISRRILRGKCPMEPTILARALHSSHSCKDAQFQMPKRIHRSSTDLLKALDNTVGRDKSGPHYRFHDDPYLIPVTPMEKRVYALSKESGRKAAAWIRDQHPHLFTPNTSDEPLIKRFLPLEKYTEDSEVTEETLQEAIATFAMEDAVTVYRLCTSKGIELSGATKQSLLEFLCFHNEEEPASDEWIEDLYFAEIQNPGKSLHNTWKSGGLAEELFEAIEEPSAAAYSALIRGLAKHNSAEDAWTRYQEAQAAGVTIDVETFNTLILTVPLRHDGYEQRREIMIGLLKTMAAKELRPNLQTLNNCLQVLSVSAAEPRKDFSLELLKEIMRQGVQPSLATYYLLLVIHYKLSRKVSSNSRILYSILDELEKHEGTIPLVDPRDTFFFMQAMEVCCNHLQDLDAARRLHAVLETGKNDRLLGQNQKEMIYYRNYLMLSAKHLPFDDFMLVYNDLVPHVYAPEGAVTELILTMVGVQGAFQYLPTLWTDLNLMILDQERPLCALVNAMTLYVPDAGDVTYHDGSGKSKKEKGLGNEFINKPVPLNEQLSRIIGHMVTHAEEAIELNRRKPNWTALLVGQMLSVVSVCGNASVGRRLLQLTAKQQGLMVGEVPAEEVHKLCTLAVKEKDFVTALNCISYVRQHDPAAVQAMAEEIRAAEPRDAAIRAKFHLLAGLSPRAKEMERSTEAHQSSSSSSSDDSDSSSSSDEEGDDKPTNKYFPNL